LHDNLLDTVLYYALITVLALVVAYLLGIFTGAHYVPTSHEKIVRMLRLAQLLPGERLVDIGSGDGRLVIEAAQEGAKAYGFELNPILVWWSHRKIRAAQLVNAEIYWKDFWRQDFSDFDVVTVYGIPHIMGLLEKKLLRELRPGARVVSNSFPFPTWKGQAEGGVFVYVKN
jgi:cyclopropane fatty-acyl-phospholipid synthase-like methyltransferase